MTSVTGMKAQAMLEIANGVIVDAQIVGNDLVLFKRDGTPINLGYVRGMPGAPGGTDEAFATWINSVNSNTYKALADRDNELHRLIGYKKNMVIVGPDRFGGSFGWPALIASAYDLTERNYSANVQGSYTGSGNFYSQLQQAAADNSFDNDDVALVFISDASYNVRQWNDGGNQVSIAAAAEQAFAYAGDMFRNARIICLPIIWPSNPDLNTYTVVGGYQKMWPYAVSQVAQQLREVSRQQGVEFIEDSWTWLTGQANVMSTDNRPIPNQNGHYVISRWVNKHLKGGNTRADTGWVDVPHTSGYSMASPTNAMPRLRVRREGWNVSFSGAMRILDLAGSAPATLAVFPVGFRPAYFAEATIRHNGGVLHYPAEINHDGVMSVWTPMSVGLDMLTSGSFTLY